MLPTELLIHRYRGETLVAKRLPLDAAHRDRASGLIDLFQSKVGRSQKELDSALGEREGASPDYKIERGLAHLLRNSFSTFEVVSPLDPVDLRRRVFTMAAATGAPQRDRAIAILETIAQELSTENNRPILPPEIRNGLYADLPENRILTQFEAPTADALLHRYNLSQIQGIFYKASHLVLTAYRNDPGEYKLLFRYLKLFQLMTYIEGDEDQGFTVTVDGPASLFNASTRYGLAIAKLLPALLHVSQWHLKATLQTKDQGTGLRIERRFELDHDCGLVSHYPPGKTYDSAIEESFVKRWNEAKTGWRLEREVNLIPIPGSVMIPDFRLVHLETGRSHILEIIGYWRPDYLRKKFAQVRQAQRPDLILAISERLNLDRAGIEVSKIPVPVIWFKDKLQPKAVLAAIGAQPPPITPDQPPPTTKKSKK